MIESATLARFLQRGGGKENSQSCLRAEREHESMQEEVVGRINSKKGLVF